MRGVVERLLALGLALLPLVCWPNLTHPFSTPKLWLAGLLGLAGVCWTYAHRGTGRGGSREWLTAAWIGAIALSAAFAPSVSLAAVLLASAPLPLAWAIGQGAIQDDRFVTALLSGSAALSAVVCLQYAGADPLTWLGWRSELFGSPRMRLYGTMGNPNFVAAWLCGTLPLYAGYLRGRRLRAWAWAGFALQAAALMATGSRAVLPAVIIGGAVMLAASRTAWRWVAAGLPIAAAALLLSPARPLQDVMRGRWYINHTAGSHLPEVPVFGFGPGAFEPQFARWQAGAATADADAAALYGGPLDHAHNDLLEFWVEYGPVGVIAFVALSGCLLFHGWRRARRGGDPGALGGAAALLAVSLVDFPFHRPAEWTLFLVLLYFSARRFSDTHDDQTTALHGDHADFRLRPLPGGEVRVPGQGDGHPSGGAGQADGARNYARRR